MFSPTDLGENQLDFSSFWSHYKLVKKWLNIEGAAREKILKELADKSSSSDQNPPNPPPSNAPQSMLNALNGHYALKGQKQQQNDDDELSAEMLDFYRTTIAHKNNREAQRRLLQNGEGGLEYCDASEVGLIKNEDSKHSSANERETQLRELYGEEPLAKLAELELTIQTRFMEEYNDKKPQIWPSIPMRF